MACCEVCSDLVLVLTRTMGKFVQCFGTTLEELLMLKSKHDSDKFSESQNVLRNNIICNPTFEDGTEGWFCSGCSLAVDNYRGLNYCIAQGRTQNWQGLGQDIGKRVELNATYELQAWVGIDGKTERCTRIQATVKLEKSAGAIEYIRLGSVQVKKGKWALLTGLFRIRDQPKTIVVYFDGPNSGTDILLCSVAIVPDVSMPAVEVKQASQVSENRQIVPKVTQTYKTRDVGLIQQPGYANYAVYRSLTSTTSPPTFQNPLYLVNVVDNSNFTNNGLISWYAMGNCRLNVSSGAPRLLGASARQSFMDLNMSPPSLSGNYVHVSKRTENFHGPAQDITTKIQVFNNYQVTAWVKTNLPSGSQGTLTQQRVNVALDVDGQWTQGGEIFAGSAWTELSGSFRLETRPSQVIVYVQGPDPGIDLMVAGLQIFAVDRLARVPRLQQQTDQIRKHDVVLNLRDSNGRNLPVGTRVSIQQTKNSFPLGTAICAANVRKEEFRNFFLKHFNFAVFENELKWEHVEPRENDIRYEEADSLVHFCTSNEIPMRGHCIVWEAESSIQSWLKKLNDDELSEAVRNRFAGLLTRYKGVFKHYDVNNEMLHGSFYKDNLGAEILPNMFKMAQKFAPDAQLFVNDYHIDDGWDCVSSPNLYVQQIQSLLAKGATIGGIGIQGHQIIPVGSIINQALDQLGVLGIPIWYTEIDVSSTNEYVRADDLEVILREAYAHPSVEGCMLWGFLEGGMFRENAALVNPDMTVNEAGRRLLALKKEWTTTVEVVVDSNGKIVFRGFEGDYTISSPKTGFYGNFKVSSGDNSPVTMAVTLQT